MTRGHAREIGCGPRGARISRATRLCDRASAVFIVYDNGVAACGGDFTRRRDALCLCARE